MQWPMAKSEPFDPGEVPRGKFQVPQMVAQCNRLSYGQDLSWGTVGMEDSWIEGRDSRHGVGE